MQLGRRAALGGPTDDSEIARWNRIASAVNVQPG